MSKTENAVLMTRAMTALQGKWGNAIGFIVVYLLITICPSWIPNVGGLIQFILEGALQIGVVTFVLSISRQQPATISQMFSDINRSMLSLGTYLLSAIFILLWALLLIIPGIIAAYAYSMTFYIMVDDDKIGPLEAITKSKEMMRGNKWKLFCLHCRFIGWALLCVLTAGIGFLWLAPYFMVSNAEFYADLKSGQAEQLAAPISVEPV